jgi:hypothetical protein
MLKQLKLENIPEFYCDINLLQKIEERGKMIAYCGIDCSKCDAYLATQANDSQKLQEVAKKWTVQFKVDITSEQVVCDGCKTNERQCVHCANSCEIRQCCLERQFASCIECGEFPCQNVGFVLDNAPGAKENLYALKR